MYAFAAVLAEGLVVTWGSPSAGGDSSAGSGFYSTTFYSTEQTVARKVQNETSMLLTIC